MYLEELPQELRQVIEELRHGSSTIECDVEDALESAADLNDFKARVFNAMDNLIGEAEAVRAILGKETVQVVIHLHCGVIFNTAVYRNAQKAREERDKEVIEHYGELVEHQEGDDFIDLQECQVIV